MQSRFSDKRSIILDVTPGEDNQEITSCRLPTYKQVLLCYIANLEKARADDKTKTVKLKKIVAKCVAKKSLFTLKRQALKLSRNNQCVLI